MVEPNSKKGLEACFFFNAPVESEGRQMKQCLITYREKKSKKIPFFFFVAVIDKLDLMNKSV